MKVGFTGSREGMSDSQKKRVKELLEENVENTPISLNQFHYGDYIGADDEAHLMAKELKYDTHCHGPKSFDNRKLNHGDINYKETECNFLLLVKYTNLLIATPNSIESENEKSGVWCTVRNAKSLNKKIHIIYPDGTEEVFNEGQDNKKIEENS